MDIEDDGTNYCDETDASEILSDFFGVDFKDMNEAMILVKEHDDDRIWVKRYGLVA